ncbi:unnamed protein product [Amoebophrya sp. A25]|nr:unnamed protein product [Amoebophrya sp. A25]|eukprot:GSA25T00017020001.1
MLTSERVLAGGNGHQVHLRHVKSEPLKTVDEVDSPAPSESVVEGPTEEKKVDHDDTRGTTTRPQHAPIHGHPPTTSQHSATHLHGPPPPPPPASKTEATPSSTETPTDDALESVAPIDDTRRPIDGKPRIVVADSNSPALASLQVQPVPSSRRVKNTYNYKQDSLTSASRQASLMSVRALRSLIAAKRNGTADVVVTPSSHNASYKGVSAEIVVTPSSHNASSKGVPSSTTSATNNHGAVLNIKNAKMLNKPKEPQQARVETTATTVKPNHNLHGRNRREHEIIEANKSRVDVNSNKSRVDDEATFTATPGTTGYDQGDFLHQVRDKLVQWKRAKSRPLHEKVSEKLLEWSRKHPEDENSS